MDSPTLEFKAAKPTSDQLVTLAQVAIKISLDGCDRPRTEWLGRLAWSNGALLTAGPEGGWTAVLLARALITTDDLDGCLEIVEHPELVDHANDGAVAALADGCRAWCRYHQGRVSAVLAPPSPPSAAASDGGAGDRDAAIAASLIEQGLLDQAQTVLGAPPGDSEAVSGGSLAGVQAAVRADAHAALRLAQRRPDDALAAARAARRLAESAIGCSPPGVVTWRTTAALAELALGRAAAARRLAAEELELARSAGVTRVVIRASRVLARATREPEAIRLLTDAVELGRTTAPRLEYIHALLDLGVVLGRARRRTAARKPLMLALERSEAGGVLAAAAAAREALSDTGRLGQRATLSGVAALTPSERRVAGLAADGLTTRQIAGRLFVTPKAIEFHLRNIYRKLGIASTRNELTNAVRTAEQAEGAVLTADRAGAADRAPAADRAGAAQR